MSGDGTGAPEDADDRGARPFDAGLQPERTALAWRRTALALVVAAVVGIRVLPTLLGAWAVVPAGAGVVLAVVVLVASHHRYREQHIRLTTASTDRIALPDGTLPGLVAAMTLSAAVACGVVVVAVATR
ncbi:DUF202 domain-containing protein [Labedella populi]|uniref:DUF202 domain-containing protein n=1 Tax=Labedella populi TaxID=2498850 RepID=A0A444QDZ7_9MICO|nr:DUF202 domain-containing protein [Labedella populi]RWZ67758.1 DUF202 domain-containing protein [Labedella populi]